MSSPSNLYAEKIFSEHPISLWALDDEINYISLINESDRNLDGWQITGGTSESSLNILPNTQPFIDSYINTIYGDIVPQGSSGEIQFISPLTINTNGIDKNTFSSDLKTFAIGFYIYAENPYLSSVSVGYRYFDEALNSYVEPETKSFNSISIENRWILVSNTFDSSKINNDIQLVIRVGYTGGALSETDNKFIINGLSMGQWSENFLSESLGISISDLPATIPLSGFKSINAASYGLEESPGYYLSTSNNLFAKNASLPMVYGTSNVTIIQPNSTGPSLIVPGFGFMGEYGRNRDYTLEAWLKISSETTVPKRILGPISSEDGLYVDGSFLALKIDSEYSAFHVSEWGRPMLVHIRLSYDTASVLLNGEQILSVPISESYQYPDRYSMDGSVQKDHDWIAFYAYEDASPIEVDCVAIYPYLVSQIVAKRRLVYGQAVEIPENINRSYSGTSTIIDYQFSKYANNYIYPDFGKWDQGIIDNLISKNNQLSIPEYKTPTLVFNNKTSEDWISDISSIQNEATDFISLRPTSDWASTSGYMLFDNLNLLSSDTKAIYGLFKQKDNDHSPKTLIKIVDEITSSYFEIRLAKDSIDYLLKYEDQEEIVYTTQKHYYGEIFAAGINIDKFVNSFGGNLVSFFGRKSGLSVYVGGNKDFSKTFTGNIYSLSFSSARNLSKIVSNFNDSGVIADQVEFLDIKEIDFDGGTPTTNDWAFSINSDDSQYAKPATHPTVDLSEHTGSYTLKLREVAGVYALDISVDAYWEDYVPLTYLAKYVSDEFGDKVYDLDFIQFNINYPAPSIYKETEETSVWYYEDLLDQFAHPIQRTYDDLDNYLFTGFEDYADLASKSVKSYSYDTSNEILRTFVTFQYLGSGLNNSYSYFSNTESANKNGVVRPGDNGEDWQITKYEVVDGMIIYPPAGVDFHDLAMVTHLEISIDGIARKPLVIKKLQLASQALEHTSPNVIGTRLGQDIYPYRKSGMYFNYKGINPFSIYKGSSPHLYLTKNSGIEIRGDYDPAVDRGISIPVNTGLATDFKVIAMQMSIQFNKDFFPFGAIKIFEVQSKSSHIKFYAVSNHPTGKRAKIYAINAKTGKKENGIAFYWNGKVTKEPNITVKEWGMLGIRFSNSLDYTNYSGAIRLTGPMLFNNISHYQSTNLQEVQQITTRPWIRVKVSGATEFDWDFWESAFNWNGVLVISETSYYGVDPSNIYKAYTGTNKIIADDTTLFRLKNYEYDFVTGISWQSSIRSPL